MYDTLAEVLRDAQTNHLHPIIAGDFNAQVGRRNDDDTTTTTGKFALDPSNARGQWLTSWAASQNLIITNTHFDKPQSDIITYYSPTQQPPQLDYILTDKPLWKHTRDAHSTQIPNLGSDHVPYDFVWNCLFHTPNHHDVQNECKNDDPLIGHLQISTSSDPLSTIN